MVRKDFCSFRQVRKTNGNRLCYFVNFIIWWIFKRVLEMVYLPGEMSVGLGAGEYPLQK